MYKKEETKVQRIELAEKIAAMIETYHEDLANNKVVFDREK